MKKYFIPPVILFISIIASALFYFFLSDLNYIIFPYNLLGLLISIVGFFIMGKARELFSKHKTTLYFEKSSSIVEEGIFSKTRNPMYIGMFLLLLGIAVFTQNIVSLVMPVVFILIIRFYFVPFEERLMFESFGRQYLEYKERTPRWF